MTELDIYRRFNLPLLYWQRVGDDPRGWKGPHEKGWPSRVYDFHQYNPTLHNVGVFTGRELSPNKRLVDVDLDKLVEAFVRPFFPPSGFMVGRPGKPLSHLFYTTPDPLQGKREYLALDDKPYIELRGEGLQTMLPPSLHTPPDIRVALRVSSGIGHVESLTTLIDAALDYSIASLTAEVFSSGLHHHIRLPLAGFLLKRQFDAPRVVKLLQTICAYQVERRIPDMTHHDIDDVHTIVTSTVERLKHNEKVSGGTLLKEIHANFLTRLQTWLPHTPHAHSVEFIRASEVPVVKIDWLWRARLAKGAITLVEGGPERGKSTLLGDVAACVTRGDPFPGETQPRDAGNVVMLVAEDDIAATVVPRLMAAGADLTRIYFLKLTKDERGEVVPFHLSDDCERLRAKCHEVGDVLLVVVDPLVSFMGSRSGRTLNTYNDMEVRKALAPLKELAEGLRVAVAAIRHYRKGVSTNAMEAGGGSVAFAALVRVIIAALPDPNDETRYLLAISKNNLVRKSERPALTYAIVSWEDDPDIGRIEWGGTVDLSADEILAMQAEADRTNTGKVGEAKQFLESFLASGEWTPTREVLQAADAQGIKKSAVERAKERLMLVRVEKRGDKWGWMLTTGEV